MQLKPQGVTRVCGTGGNGDAEDWIAGINRAMTVPTRRAKQAAFIAPIDSPRHCPDYPGNPTSLSQKT
jgi:hypothetical protein